MLHDTRSFNPTFYSGRGGGHQPPRVKVGYSRGTREPGSHEIFRLTRNFCNNSRCFGVNFLSQEEISCQRQKCPITRRNFLPLDEISCQRKKLFLQITAILNAPVASDSHCFGRNFRLKVLAPTKWNILSHPAIHLPFVFSPIACLCPLLCLCSSL